MKIDDQVEDPTYKGVFNFKDGANEEIEYEYDKNGNLVKDLNKNISKIEYNLLNLPSKITFGNGKTITYVYDATGVKLVASYNAAAPASNYAIIYCGNMIYEDDTFKQVLFDGGYITFTDNRAMYHYYLKDHLGNNRIVVSSKGEVEQVNHYYPYGGIMAESTNESVQRYKYNGKELDRMHGLDWYDYGARWMADGRFATIDPHAETYADVSPYAYCGGNPISAIDLNGEDNYTLTSNGKIVLQQQSNDERDFLSFGKKQIALVKGILKQLISNRRDYDGNYAISSNKNDMLKLFKFVADNTTVEWGLDMYEDRAKLMFDIRTQHRPNEVGPLKRVKDSNMIAMVHSHTKYSNSHQASGENVSHIKSGKSISGYFDFGDLGRYADMVCKYQAVHNVFRISQFPKAYIYDAGGKPAPSLFQYTHITRRFGNHTINNYVDFIKYFKK